MNVDWSIAQPLLASYPVEEIKMPVLNNFTAFLWLRKMTVPKLLLSSPNLPKSSLAFVESGREDSCDLAS